MARDDSSSSGFSSDEDMADVSDLPSASYVPNVQVEVLEDDTDASSVLPCCQEAANPIQQVKNPLDLQYEQYTTAIGHLTWHWPTEDENRLKSYYSLRAELYKTFQKAFPLTEAMYIQWISDASADEASVEEIQELFELSQADYWSVPLTLQYLRFIKDNKDEEELSRAMIKAQKTLGMHFGQGHEVWALCRELTTEKHDEMETQDDLKKERELRELFVKQMQLPLDQNDLVMSEFRAWNAYNTLDAEASSSAFEEVSKKQSKLFSPLMKKLRGFEARINAAPGTEDAPEQAWQQYLNFVKHRVAPLMTNDGGRQLVVCLYERAMAIMCLSSTLWESYLEYLEPDQADAASKETDGNKLEVARRAVRNVPFDASVWTELLIEMERQNKSMEDISLFVRLNLLERLSSPMEQYNLLSVLLAWCDSVRRYGSTIEGEHLDDAVQQVEVLVGGVFTQCERFIEKVFPDFVDGKFRLADYRAKCYWVLMPPDGPPRRTPAIAMKTSKVDKLWEKTLETPLGDLAATWIAYFDALRLMNAFSVQSIRAMVYDKAVQRVKDSPVVLAESWLQFERENGDLTNYIQARRYHVKHRTPVQAAAVVPPTNSEGDKKTKKRKASAADGNQRGKKVQKQPAAKRAKPDDGGATAMEVDKVKALRTTEKKKVHESLTNDHTLFLCNVSKEASKGDIEELFGDITSLKDVRLVVKTRGDRVKSRGMAYVQFTDDAGVEAGLKKDGFLLHGHPLRVERSKPPPTSASTPSAKAESFWKTDPLTLYVGDLNREGSKQQVTEEQLQVALQQSMQSAGELVVVNRVSILKDRHGKLKNYGLVEVAEPSQVAFCLANVTALQGQLGEQVTMKPSRFSITHILEQQEKQHKQKQQRKAGAAPNKGTNAPHARPSTRLNLPSSGSATSLMPRALRRKLAAAPKTTEPSEAAIKVTPKSNEDFRKMLFNN
ncbi:Squamous cell carcinoma antigen recognized by T-cells 3 [Phytophthora citrophthora]|uniref:Squamous cell carcinoma antigen recognized by T-cells 3 n=1 Tax=Phytophthora citrophthora TaxID=4793 RepID=A0AAD9GR34_9STRA|nr:Squamous cell carcinoma antigen recognized by T-cells 3 [Phytophthora citrophthora]